MATTVDSDILARLSKVPLSTEKLEKVAEALGAYIAGQVSHEVDRALSMVQPVVGPDSAPSESSASVQLASRKKLTKP